jgi:excisionase family DNA binding protein
MNPTTNGTTRPAGESVDLSHRLLTPTEVAELLCLPASTVYELARSGRLPCLRIGRAVRFDRHTLEAHITRNCQI